MTKEELIQEIVTDMNQHLNNKQLEILKTILVLDMKDVEITYSSNLPSVEVHNNLWILQRYTIDLVATNHAEGTVKLYIHTLKKFFEMSGIPYARVKADDISTYLAIRKQKFHISPNTQLSEYKHLRAFFKWCYKKHHIFEDIAEDLTPVKEVPKKKEMLTKEEIENIRLNIPSYLIEERALFELMLSTGIRVGEILELRVENIDFDKEEVAIFGQKTNTWRVGFLSAAAKVALKRFLGNRTDGYVFLNARGNKSDDRRIEKMAKLLGELGPCHCTTTVHVYRKTFASMLYKKTSDILLVSKMLGHASSATTVKYYLIEDLDDMKYRVNK